MPGYPSGQRGQTVNLLGLPFLGSNPRPGTIFVFICEIRPLPGFSQFSQKKTPASEGKRMCSPQKSRWVRCSLLHGAKKRLQSRKTHICRGKNILFLYFQLARASVEYMRLQESSNEKSGTLFKCQSNLCLRQVNFSFDDKK